MSKDKFILYILVASLIVNIYFVYRYVNVKPTIIVKDKIVEKVVEVVRVEDIKIMLEGGEEWAKINLYYTS